MFYVRRRKEIVVVVVENDGLSTLCNGSNGVNSVKVSIHMIKKKGSQCTFFS